MLALCLASPLAAQVASDTVVVDVDEFQPFADRQFGPCQILNEQGPIASGFLGYNEGATHAVLFDPAGTDDPGDPGCGTTIPPNSEFVVENAAFLLADRTAFGQPGGVGTTTYTLSLHPLAVAGDPTAGPGAAIAAVQQTLEMDASAVYTVVAPFGGITVDGPFFLAVTFDDFAPDAEVISPLWDGVARPLGRQFINNNDGGGFIDQTDFFTAGGNGWVVSAIEGAILPSSQPVNTLSPWSIALLILALAAGSIVVLRRVA